MKKILVLFWIISLFTLTVSGVSAHSGCCSHHDGVRPDGCGCNDGTPLSDTCAPYYACTANSEQTSHPVYIAPTYTSTPVPTWSPTPKPTATPTIKPTMWPKPTKKPVKHTKKTNKPKPTPTPHKSWWQMLFGM